MLRQTTDEMPHWGWLFELKSRLLSASLTNTISVIFSIEIHFTKTNEAIANHNQSCHKTFKVCRTRVCAVSVASAPTRCHLVMT